MDYNINDFLILDNYYRRGKSVTLTARMFNIDNENINNFGRVYIELGNTSLIKSVSSYEYGVLKLQVSDMEKLATIIKNSNAYQKALESYNKGI